METKEIVNNIEFNKSGFGSVAFEPFKKDRYARISFDYTQLSRSGSAGLMLNVGGSGQAGKLAFEFDAANNQINFFNNVKGLADLGEVNFKIPYKFENNKKIHIDVYYDDQVTTVYVDQTVALTARTYALKDAPFAIYARDKRCIFQNIKFYE